VGLPTARWKEQRVCAKTALATNGKRDISIVSESEDDSEKYKDHTLDQGEKQRCAYVFGLTVAQLPVDLMRSQSATC